MKRASCDKFGKLYHIYYLLSNAKDNASEYAQEYLEVIEATKGDQKEKQLASQIIAAFFKYFPSLQCKAIEAIFDLCEDDEASVRIAAMKRLPALCQDKAEFVSKIADILAQLLQLKDPLEYDLASSSLMQILMKHPITVVKSVFKQLKAPENLVRDKCIKFLITKLKTLKKSILTEKVKDVIITETKTVLQDVTAEEFVYLMPFLISTTNISRTPKGQQELLNIVANQAEMDKPLAPLDKESNNVNRLITCVKFVLPFFSTEVKSTKFVSYFCCYVFPEWNNIATLEHGELLHLLILRQLAEMSTHCGKLNNMDTCLANVYRLIEEYMPSPPDNADVKTMPLLNFTFVECLLYVFHRLARQNPQFITTPPRSLKNFQARLTYFSRCVHGCNKALHDFDEKENISDEEMKKRKLSPKLFNNINTLMKDLFYQPSKYQCNVTLSFKVEVATRKKKQKKPKGGHGTNKEQLGSSKSTENQQLYKLPSGKFIDNSQIYRGKGRDGIRQESKLRYKRRRN
ncbi:hypothetical protein ILUMI_12352 [Ignelater luminosus]|uniref:Apoptosis inhibitor 5 n=1 Tax=Ignelater luminosus TaxID=2038154 RepID=A0A8K0D311_IGNLU|nr:hypothetical protein ILUMI_12352 [Ignelater luminosus]